MSMDGLRHPVVISISAVLVLKYHELHIDSVSRPSENLKSKMRTRLLDSGDTCVEQCDPVQNFKCMEMRNVHLLNLHKVCMINLKQTYALESASDSSKSKL